MANLDLALVSAGLSDKEARVYLAALELGSATATLIARKAGVNRATTYVVADNLILRGLMSSVERDAKRFFVAEPPATLLARLQKEEETVEERRHTLETALPELEALVKGSAERPSVRYYEGLHGLDTMRDILYRNRRGEVLSAVNLDAPHRALSPENIRAHQKNMKLYDLVGRVLYTASDERAATMLTDSASKATHEHRRVPADSFPFEGEVVIFGNAVAFISYDKKITGAIVEHPHFAKTMRSIFELAWKATEKI